MPTYVKVGPSTEIENVCKFYFNEYERKYEIILIKAEKNFIIYPKIIHASRIYEF